MYFYVADLSNFVWYGICLTDQFVLSVCECVCVYLSVCLSVCLDQPSPCRNLFLQNSVVIRLSEKILRLSAALLSWMQSSSAWSTLLVCTGDGRFLRTFGCVKCSEFLGKTKRYYKDEIPSTHVFGYVFLVVCIIWQHLSINFDHLQSLIKMNSYRYTIVLTVFVTDI